MVRARPANVCYRAAAPSSQRILARLVRGHGLLLRFVLLAHLLDDSLRRPVDGRRVSSINSGSGGRRFLSGRVRFHARAGDQTLGPLGGAARAGLLARARVGAPDRYGPTLERARLLTGFSS